MNYHSIAHVEPDYELCLFFSDWLEEHDRLGEAQVLRWIAHNRLWPATDELVQAPGVVGVWWCKSMGSCHWLERKSHYWWLPCEACPRTPHVWFIRKYSRVSRTASQYYRNDILERCDDPFATALEWACRNVDLRKVPEESIPKPCSKEALLK